MYQMQITPDLTSCQQVAHVWHKDCGPSHLHLSHRLLTVLVGSARLRLCRYEEA